MLIAYRHPGESIATLPFNSNVQVNCGRITTAVGRVLPASFGLASPAGGSTS